MKRSSNRSSRWLYFYVASFLHECAIFLICLAEPIYAGQQLGGSAQALGLMGALCGSGYAICALAAGRLSDRGGRRRWVIFGATAEAIVIALLPLCRHLHGFIALVALHITFMGFYWTPMMSLLSDSTPPAELSKVLGRFNISWCLGSILGSLISGLLYQRLGPTAPFVASALLMVGVVIIVSVVPAPSAAPRQRAEALEPASDPRWRWQAWLVLAANFYMLGLLIFIFPKLALGPRLDMDAGAITRLHALRQGTMLLAFAVLGRFAHWRLRQYPFHAAFGLMAGAMLLIAALERSAWMPAPFAAFGVALGVAFVLSAYYSMSSPTKKGFTIGVHEALLSAGIVLGSLGGALLVQITGDLRDPFWWGLAPIMLAWAGCAALGRRGDRPPGEIDGSHADPSPVEDAPCSPDPS